MAHPHHSKNIVYGNITAGGNVHIGDVYYTIESDFKQSILFLRIEKLEEELCTLNLSIKSKHGTSASLNTAGENLLHEAVKVSIPHQLFEELDAFQTFRRGVDHQMRWTGLRDWNPSSVIALENQLSQLLFQTFFSGDIGQVCTDFIQLLEERRIEELLLAISADDDSIVNLPFEMVLPALFPPKMAQTKNSLAVNNFGLVRTKKTSLAFFELHGNHATAAPLKMLFITALPENLDERGKMLQIEDEQTRLIRSIGALEATGDKKPKIVIEFLDNASLTELDKALHERRHDIVHISGHGAYQVAENKGVLYFENEDGDEEQITGAALGERLRQHACVKLLILSACETAIAGSEGGVTEQVATYGVPGIVAMRFAVTDEGAKIFTTEFYTQLANGLTLTQAVAYARERLHQDILQRREQSPQVIHLAEWFTPVVYQNQLVGALIDPMQPYHLSDHFYPLSSFLKTKHSRLIGEGFIGRKRYLIRMRKAFQEGKHLCLHGLGGLGKTTLAEAFAHNYDNHSHTILMFRNGHQINEAHILKTLNHRFAKTNPDLAEQLQQTIDDPQVEVLNKLQLLIDNYLNGRKTILLFDNAEDVQTGDGGDYQHSIASESLSSFLRYLCENAPQNCHVLFTTRYKIEDLADVVEHLSLDKMSYAEQYRLLNYSEVLRDIPMDDRDEVYKRLDGHPRGYEYLEALLKKDKTFRWEQVAKSEEQVFENLLLAKVYERLTEHEKAIFKIVSVFITRTPLAALAAVSGELEAELWPVLQSLQDWSLCFLENDGRFEAHRLTREWMRQQVIPSEKVKEYALKAGEYFTAQLTWGDELLAKDYFEVAEAWQQFASTSFRLQGHYQLIGLYPQAFELNQAVLEKNVEEKSISTALFNMGAIHDLFGHYDQALSLYDRCLSIDKKIDDRQGEGATLNNISQIYSAKGDYDTALRYLEQSLAITKQIGDRKGEGATLNNISQIHKVRGDYDTALRYLEQSLAIRQQIGDRQGEGTTLNNLATTALAKGDYDTALRYLEQSLAILQQIGDRKGESVTLNNLSSILYARGKVEEAMAYSFRDLQICQEIGDINGMATTMANIGAMLFEQESYEEAIPILMQAYAILEKIGSPNVKYPLQYLGEIIERIGKAKFEEIVSRME